MKQATETKLAALLDDAEAAKALVEAGFDTPRKVKAAKKADLDAAVGKTKADAAKARFRAGAK